MTEWEYQRIVSIGLGWQELILLFLVVLLIFGAKRIPEIAQGLGKGIREFKKAMKETEEEVKASVKEEDSKNRKQDNARHG
jgi:sec-independent protein translocase protein TatA